MPKDEFNGVVNSYMDSTEIKFKKGVVQTFFWIVGTITVYFIWGTQWYFWVLFAISIVMVVSVVFIKISLKELRKTVHGFDAMQQTLDRIEENESDEKEEYTQQQKALESLLNALEEIGEEHGEIYDTDCREQMREVIHRSFVFQTEEYVMPNSFGLYTPEGNELVGKALHRYLATIKPLTQDAKTAKERLTIFQDTEVYSDAGQSYDEFFGWVDEKDLKIVSNDIEETTISIKTKIFGEHEYISSNGLDFDMTSMILNNKTSHFEGMIFEDLNKVQIEKAVLLLDAIEVLDAKARDKWLSLLNAKDEEVCDFIDVHYNDYGEEIRNEICQKLNVNKQDNVAFIENLEFGSFHITEGDEEDSVEIVMDYSLIWKNGSSFTDQILAMHFNDKLEYEMHTHDS